MKIVCLLIILSLMPAQSSQAHKVTVSAFVEDGVVYSKSSFGPRKMAKNCPMEVLDAKGSVLISGVTDEKGLFSFKIPEDVYSDLTLILDAGSGHRGTWKIKKAELKNNHPLSNVKNRNRISILLRAISGIMIIFLMAGIAAWMKKRRGNK